MSQNKRKDLSEYRKINKLCIVCGSKLDKGETHKSCLKCRNIATVKRNEYKQAMKLKMLLDNYEKSKEVKYCKNCGKESLTVTCEFCAKVIKTENERIRRAKFVKEGRCHCGRPLDNKNYKTCTKCREKSLVTTKQRYALRKQQGVCVDCGYELEDKRYSRCKVCRIKHTLSNKKWRENL